MDKIAVLQSLTVSKQSRHLSLCAISLFITLFPFFSFAQLITNVQLVDGTGKPAYPASVRIKHNRILAIGKLKPQNGELVIDGKGLMLAPGFIDAHSHHFSDVQRNTDALSTSNQGITTIVIGQDGSGYYMDSLDLMMKRIPVAVNVASYTGHTSLREEVMGERDVLRPAKQEEIDRMKIRLQSELKKGSLGLSTGLEYEQAFYSTRDEVMQLSIITAVQNGRYISHIRSEDVTMDDALNEIIEIGRATKMPVQISHIKIAKKSDWGAAQKVISKLEAARKEGIKITADVYPYNFWHSTIRVLFPGRDYNNIKSAEFAVNQLFDPRQSRLAVFAPIPSYKGKTISEIASTNKETDAQTLMNLIAMASEFKQKNPDHTGGIEAITAKSMSDNDVADFIAWPHSVICSDGNAGAHPRGYGSFTRILGRYVREEKLLTLEQAIHKMTGLTAAHLGISKRGIVKPGYYADLVLFDPKTVLDHATIENSKALSSGVEMVWVNGKMIYQKGRSTGEKPGMLLKR
jgi:N-acyl-D-aspartate/D-glutamate deacylase